MKKMKWLSIGVCILLVSSLFTELTASVGNLGGGSTNGSYVSTNNVVGGNLGNNHTQVLSMVTTENITVLSNGDSDVTISTTIPSSPLTPLYREALCAPVDARVGETMPIPEEKALYCRVGNISEGAGVGEVNVSNVSETFVPVRDQIFNATIKEHLCLLGFLVEPVDAEMMPYGGEGEMKFSLNARVDGFAGRELDNLGTLCRRVWEINIGPRDENYTINAMGHLLDQMSFIQLLLGSLDGVQEYYYEWDIGIELPNGSVILNEEEIKDIGWRLWFGEGAYTEAFVSVEGSTVVLSQKTVIGEDSFTISPEELFQALSAFRVFRIEYQLETAQPSLSSPQPLSGVQQMGLLPNYFFKQFPLHIVPQPVSFSIGPAKISVSPAVYITAKLMWKRDGNGVREFESSMMVTPKIDVGITATLSATVKQTYEGPSWTYHIHTFMIMIGLVPVFIAVEAEANTQLEVSAEAKVTFTVKAYARVDAEYGVKWTRGVGWEPISTTSPGKCGIREGPTLSGQVSLTVKPSIGLRVQALLYWLAGPYLEIAPYAEGTVTVTTSGECTWKVELGADVNCGMTFADVLEKFLGLEDFNIKLGTLRWVTWNGVCGEPGPPHPPEKYDIEITLVTAECGTTEPRPPIITDCEWITQVTAKPNEGFKFGHWMLDGQRHDRNPHGVEPEAGKKDRKLEAVFQIYLDVTCEPSANVGVPIIKDIGRGAKRYWFDVNTKQLTVEITDIVDRCKDKFKHWELRDGIHKPEKFPDKQMSITVSNDYDKGVDASLHGKKLVAVFGCDPWHDIGLAKVECKPILTFGGEHFQETSGPKETIYVEEGDDYQIAIDYYFRNYGGYEKEKYTAEFEILDVNNLNGPAKLEGTREGIGTIWIKDCELVESFLLNTKDLTKKLAPGKYKVFVDLIMKGGNKDDITSNNRREGCTIIIGGKSAIDLKLLCPRNEYIYIFTILTFPFPNSYSMSVSIGPLWLSADAKSDAGIKEVQFAIDGITASWDNSYPYTYFWVPPITQHGINDYIITATAIGNDGNTATVSQLVVAVWLAGEGYGPP